MASMVTLILFGIVQGLTEFLPVSSSGHLSLFQYFSKEINENLSLNIAVHLGTLLTICFFYRSELTQMIQGVMKKDKESWGMVFLIGVATLPTGLIGLMIKKQGGWILTDPLVASICLLLTGILLFFSDRLIVNQSFQTGFGIHWSKAFLIGIVQGVAVLPGISRSGTTILAGLFLGMNPKNASRFSFLVSLPAIAGAGLLEFKDLNEGVEISSFLIGGFVSFIVGLFAISWMVRLTMGKGLKIFSYYLIPISLLSMLCVLMGWGQSFL